MCVASTCFIATGDGDGNIQICELSLGFFNVILVHAPLFDIISHFVHILLAITEVRFGAEACKKEEKDELKAEQ